MATKDQLKGKFRTGDEPTGPDFALWIESMAEQTAMDELAKKLAVATADASMASQATVQAVIGADSTIYTSLKERLDSENKSLTTQLADKVSKVNGVAPDVNGNVTISVPEVDTSKLATKIELADKAQKNDVRFKAIKLSQTDMTDEFLQQMAGTTPINAVPADGSITDIKLANGLSPKKLKGIETKYGLNLFDKKTARTGGYYNKDTGVFTANVAYWASDFIPVDEGGKYAKSGLGHNTYWDADKSFVSGEQVTGFTIPTGAGIKYVIFSSDGDIDTYMMIIGISVGATPYEPYSEKYLLGGDHYTVEVADNSVSPIKLVDTEKIPSENLLDPSEIDIGGHYNDLGVYVTTGKSTDFIPVSPEDTLQKNMDSYITYWDDDMNFISGQFSNTPFVFVPSTANIKYMKASFLNVEKSWIIKNSALKISSAAIPYEEKFKLGRKFVLEAESRINTDIIRAEVNKFKANASIPLDIKTYEGSNQAMHPKVLYFKNKWNGYQYWMAYTPFPNSNDRWENPCITVSNDGIEWTVPVGLVNPLDKPEHAGTAFLSDTHLVFIEATSTLEAWYRGVTRAPNQEVVYRRTTKDGVNWSVREELHRIDAPSLNEIMSPCVIYDDVRNLYQIWTVSNVSGEHRAIDYYESVNGLAWTKIRTIKVFGEFVIGQKTPWHLDVLKSNVGYEFLFSAMVGASLNLLEKFWYSKSSDNITYSNPVAILEKGYRGHFDSAQMYRASLVREGDNEISIFYSAKGDNEKWATGLVKTPRIKLLTDLLVEDS